MSGVSSAAYAPFEKDELAKRRQQKKFHEEVSIRESLVQEARRKVKEEAAQRGTIHSPGERDSTSVEGLLQEVHRIRGSDAPVSSDSVSYEPYAISVAIGAQSEGLPGGHNMLTEEQAAAPDDLLGDEEPFVELGAVAATSKTAGKIGDQGSAAISDEIDLPEDSPTMFSRMKSLLSSPAALLDPRNLLALSQMGNVWEFCSPAEFQKPVGCTQAFTRIKGNLPKYKVNYVLLGILILVMNVLTQPSLLITTAAFAILWVYSHNNDIPLFKGIVIKGKLKFVLMSVVTGVVMFYLFAGTLWWVMTLTAICALGHGAFHKVEDESEEALSGDEAIELMASATV